MKYYFDNVLKGFKTQGTEVSLQDFTRKQPDFLVLDVDQDDMPEIVFAFKRGREKQIGVLKRDSTAWRVNSIMDAQVGRANGIFTLVEMQDEVCITPKDVGKVMSIQSLFKVPEVGFIGYVDGKLYYGQLVPKTDREEKTDEEVGPS